MTFDVLSAIPIGIQYGWQRWYEAFSICRDCSRSTTFVLSQSTRVDIEYFDRRKPTDVEGSLNPSMDVDSYVSLKDRAARAPPQHVPENIENAFKEAATCLTVGCWNAAGAMFRLCVDLATSPLLPPEGTHGIKRIQRRNLGLRLPWLFDNGLLPRALEPLSTCVREDGNDAAHAGTLTRHEAEDLLDFAVALLERIYTEPERLAEAERRRVARREAAKKKG